MKIIERIEADFKEALKSKDESKISTLRLLKSAIKNKEIDKKQELTDDELSELILKEIKKRKESEDIYRKNNREDLAEKEKKEVEILQKYAPEQLTEKDLEKIIEEAITKIGATKISDIGRIMSEVMPNVKGKADGSIVSRKVAELLKHGDE